MKRDTKLVAIYYFYSWLITTPLRKLKKALSFFKYKRLLLLLLKDKDTYRKLLRNWRDLSFSRIVGYLEKINSANILYNNYSIKSKKKFLSACKKKIEQMEFLPLISIVMPTYNTPLKYLEEAIISIREQLYKNWELCIVDDGSSSFGTKEMLLKFTKLDSRIKVHFLESNFGVSKATNKAIELASGEFIVFMDHDDLLEKQALMRVAESINKDKPDFLYSDEIQISEAGTLIISHTFRPSYSEEFLKTNPYIVHLLGFKRLFLKRLGGLDENLKISQDYDLILRATEEAKVIVHIPEVLYRWRIVEGSAGHVMKKNVMETSIKILQKHIKRKKVDATIEHGPRFNLFSVKYKAPKNKKVAIIIPSKDCVELLKKCIETIKLTTNKELFHVYIINHESIKDETINYFSKISKSNNISILNFFGEFNFSKINNWAVSEINKTKKNYSHYLFCNNDIEAIEKGWLQYLINISVPSSVGIAGPMLLYPDKNTIQHAGVCIGLNGIAEHYGKFSKLSVDSAGYLGAFILTREVSAVTAACLLIKKDIFNEIKGFDERIKVGYGDTDLCLKVHKKGYKVLFCPSVKLIHHESMTRGISYNDNHPEDTNYFLKKWNEILKNGDFFYNPNLSLSSLNYDFKTDNLPSNELIRRVALRNKLSNKIKYKYSN